MSSFDLEMLEGMFLPLFQLHPTYKERPESGAKALAVFFKNAIDGRVNNDDISKTETTGYGYVNEISVVKKEKQELVFLKVSLIVGRKKQEDKDQKMKLKYQYLDLLVDRSLSDFFGKLAKAEINPFENTLLKLNLENLFFEPILVNEKPLLNSSGILKKFEICNGGL